MIKLNIHFLDKLFLHKLSGGAHGTDKVTCPPTVENALPRDKRLLYIKTINQKLNLSFISFLLFHHQ